MNFFGTDISAQPNLVCFLKSMTWHNRWWLSGRAWLLVVCALVLFINNAVQAAERNVPGDYKTIQAAIDASKSGDTVLVEPGTYSETITLRSNIILRGRETARTLLEGNGEDPVITADGVTDARISNFTFIDASTGLRITGNGDITVASNVFNTGKNGTAVTVLDSAVAEINNNTFYDNDTAINRGHDGVKIRNNIFLIMALQLPRRN